MRDLLGYIPYWWTSLLGTGDWTQNLEHPRQVLFFYHFGCSLYEIVLCLPTLGLTFQFVRCILERSFSYIFLCMVIYEQKLRKPINIFSLMISWFCILFKTCQSLEDNPPPKKKKLVLLSIFRSLIHLGLILGW